MTPRIMAGTADITDDVRSLLGIVHRNMSSLAMDAHDAVTVATLRDVTGISYPVTPAVPAPATRDMARWLLAAVIDTIEADLRDGPGDSRGEGLTWDALTCFTDLHDYRDANMYLLDMAEEFGVPIFINGAYNDELIERDNAVISLLDSWIKNGVLLLWESVMMQ